MKYRKITQRHLNYFSEIPDNSFIKSYILVDKRFLHIRDKINFNLYFHEKPLHMKLLLQRDGVIDKNKNARIQKFENIYTSKLEQNRYEEYKNTHLNEIVNDKALSMDEKTEIVYEATSKLSGKIFENPKALENVRISKEIVNPILQSVFGSHNTIASYIKIIEYDYYTHTHSLNVSIYALCLGVTLGLDEENLRDLGRSALLHDLGKSQVDHNIVDKKGVLTALEYEQIQIHPVLGYEIAISIGVKNKNILDGIRHHHEKLDGKGYPDKLKNEEISLFPRIIGVCDVFDALTTRRSYKQAMSSYSALKMMKFYMPCHLDMKILDSFIKTLHK